MAVLQCTCRARQPSSELVLLCRAFASSLRQFSHTAGQQADNPPKDAPRSNTPSPRTGSMQNMIRRITPGQRSTRDTTRPLLRRTPQSGGVLKAPKALLERAALRAKLNARSPAQIALDRYAAKAVKRNRQGEGPQAARRRAFRRAQTEAEDEDEAAANAADRVFKSLIEEAEVQEVREYEPETITLTKEDLSSTWPALPSQSTTSSSVAIPQELSRLTQRFPNAHTYDFELALDLEAGHSVTFTSEEQKSRVLAITAERRERRFHSEKTRKENKGKEWHPSQPLPFHSRENESRELADTFVRGKYPELAKQRAPLLDQVARLLRNNETYSEEKAGKLIATIETMLQNRQQQQQQQKTPTE